MVSYYYTNNLVIGNTLFQLPTRRKWQCPGDRNRNQIDYTLISKKLRIALLSAKTYPGVNCYSHHVPVPSKFKLKLMKTQSTSKNIKLDLTLLKSNQTLGEKYCLAIQNKFEVLGEAEDVYQQ